MATATDIPLPRRPELIIRPLGDDGAHVVKDPRTDAFYTIGPHEAFLLERLDGTQTRGAICDAFSTRFGAPIAAEDLDEFLGLARGRNFLTPAPAPDDKSPSAPGTASAPASAASAAADSAPDSGNSILFFRRRIFDPDRLFTWLAPKVGFFWSRTFFVLSLTVIAFAGVVLCSNWNAMLRHFPSVIRWETMVLGWVTLFVVTTLHEFAHGLTCKRYGGEVREVGFLLMFFMPCFYCNVSDAWLFREKSKRLWVTLAGGYCDLCIWALAVLVWRVTLPGTMINYLAWVVFTVCGVRVFLNFNPLIKLDGYYLLSDWAAIPNLRQRAFSRLAAHVRWLLWGAERPEPEARGRFLLTFALVSWLFTVCYMTLFLVAMIHLLGVRWGFAGVALVALLAYVSVPGLFAGFTAGEVWRMLKFRHKRTALWLGILVGVPALMFVIPKEETASGPFKVRPAPRDGVPSRAEVRAPVSGFLKLVHKDEGDRVSAGVALATLDVPDLDAKQAQKKAELREAQAKLDLLRAGPRREEVYEQKQRVARATHWRDLARQDLERKRQVLKEDLVKLDEQIAQTRTEAQFAEGFRERVKRLTEREALAQEKYREAEKHAAVLLAQLEQVQAQKRAREAQGTLEDENELARREKDIADTQSVLTILEAGARPEEILAEEARSARLQAELDHLASIHKRLQVAAPVTGVVITPRLREKIGSFLKEGDLICEVEDPTHLEAEIIMEEQEVARIKLGQNVDLKIRALPFDTFHAKVARIAPCAVKHEKELQSTVTLYCRLEDANADVRSGLTGHARISCGRSTVGLVLTKRFVRYLRTEFFWW